MKTQPYKKKTVSAAKALEIMLNKASVKQGRVVSLEEALGFVLAKSIKAGINVPLFDNSAMDGFAINAEDVGREVELEIIGEVQAGQEAKIAVKAGQAISIMTGAMVPKGAAAVIPIENTEAQADVVRIKNPVKEGANIRRRGEDIKKGTVLIKAATLLKPIHIALAASVGIAKLAVIDRPKVALIVTGTEIVKPPKALKPGQIYDSNSFLLGAELKRLGLDVTYVANAQDTLQKTVKELRMALKKADVVLTTGGISVGKYDLVAKALSKIGAVNHFGKVKQKPGKPLSFFTYKNKAIVSLPGNPVAASISFELYVRPMLLKMAGNKQVFRPEIKAVLSQDIKKKKGRQNWVRVFLSQKDGLYYAKPTGAQGSGILTSMVADGIAVIEEDADFLKKGQKVRVIRLASDYK